MKFHKHYLIATLILLGLLLSCTNMDHKKSLTNLESSDKLVVYQLFVRLFGNKNSTNKPWGTIEENGVGKFSDINDAALTSLKKMGVDYVWYNGVLHHALVGDYTPFGISEDDPDVIKGRAGSPFAIKDYYSVNPDLADSPEDRLEEFENLIERTHRHGLKVIIDIVPNHVARNYQSIAKPDGVEDLGVNDDKSVEYARNNNFYYVPERAYEVPDFITSNKVLGGDAHPLKDGEFFEVPAKWTGNGTPGHKPKEYDWYETVKINYGVKPDGSHDFPKLPKGYESKNVTEHQFFWAQQSVPNSWIKFKEIVLYWTAKGVDGFRFDMAELVPLEFWSYLNSAIKTANPDGLLIADIYNPKNYRNHIFIGKMDYLYDKVGLYDSLHPLIQGEGSTDIISAVQKNNQDIGKHLLHFVENHDELRIASKAFAGDSNRSRPALVIAATLSRAPVLIYFGQEVGEDAVDEMGFGDRYCGLLFKTGKIDRS